MPHIFHALRGQCKKLKYGIFARLNPRHVRGEGALLKPACIYMHIYYTYWERAHLQQKADA